MKSKNYLYLTIICLIAIAIVLSAMACIYYKMPEIGIPL